MLFPVSNSDLFARIGIAILAEVNTSVVLTDVLKRLQTQCLSGFCQPDNLLAKNLYMRDLPRLVKSEKASK